MQECKAIDGWTIGRSSVTLEEGAKAPTVLLILVNPSGVLNGQYVGAETINFSDIAAIRVLHTMCEDIINAYLMEMAVVEEERPPLPEGAFEL